MKMLEFLDRTGILLTREESKMLDCYKDDNKPFSEWLCLFEALGIYDPRAT